MIRLGLTGSIGMGKSTTASMFADLDVPVHESDAAVHQLYSGRAAPLIDAAFPGTVINDVVDRASLSERVLGDPEALARLEAIVHPLVRESQDAFLEEAQSKNAPIAVLDIPLLFETGATDRVDKILVVTAPLPVQRERVLARPGMDQQKLDAILARQVPDADKRAQADYIIDTSLGFDCARAKVADIVSVLTVMAAGNAPEKTEAYA